MKILYTLGLTALLLVPVAAVAADADDMAIIEVVDRAYVQGVHVESDAGKMRDGFHESFVMFVRNKDGVTQMTRDAWIERVEATRAKPGFAPRTDTRGVIEVLDRTGDAAVVRVKLFRGEKQIFTDYISLYRFEDGWKLVGKTFERH